MLGYLRKNGGEARQYEPHGSRSNRRLPQRTIFHSITIQEGAAQTMNRSKYGSLCALFAAILLIAPAPPLLAVDVCTPVDLGGQAGAEAYCGGCCEEGCTWKCSALAQQMGISLPTTIPSTCGTRENWNGNWLMTSDTLKCGGNNQKNSVCGCKVHPSCQCDNGEQRECLEPARCWDDCSCSKGTVCNAQYQCVKGGDTTCCGHCRSTIVTCNAECVFLSGTQKIICNNACLEQWKLCAGGCGGWCNY